MCKYTLMTGYRQDDKRVFNLTKIHKLGLEVGRITLFFEKQE